MWTAREVTFLAAFSRWRVTQQKPLLGRCAHTFLAAASPHTPSLPPLLSPTVQAPWRLWPWGGAQVTVPESLDTVLSPLPGGSSSWQQARCTRAQLPPLLGRCSFCTEAPGLALRGLLLSLCFCDRSSHMTLHVTDSPRQVGRKGAPGRETACAKVCRNRRIPMLRAVLMAGPHSGHAGTTLSRVHDLPCCSPPHNGKDFLPASCV